MLFRFYHFPAFVYGLRCRYFGAWSYWQYVVGRVPQSICACINIERYHRLKNLPVRYCKICGTEIRNPTTHWRYGMRGMPAWIFSINGLSRLAQYA